MKHDFLNVRTMKNSLRARRPQAISQDPLKRRRTTAGQGSANKSLEPSLTFDGKPRRSFFMENYRSNTLLKSSSPRATGMKMFKLASTSTTKKQKDLEEGPSEPESERSGASRSSPFTRRCPPGNKSPPPKPESKKIGPLYEMSDPNPFQKIRSSKANVKSFAESSAPQFGLEGIIKNLNQRMGLQGAFSD